jgi:hypothetical protein
VSRETPISLQRKDNSLENKNLSEERLLKEQKAQDKLDYLVRTRNKLRDIVRVK